MGRYIVLLETDRYSVDYRIAAEYCPVMRCGNGWIAICDDRGIKRLTDATKTQFEYVQVA